jgi:ribonuclease E
LNEAPVARSYFDRASSNANTNEKASTSAEQSVASSVASHEVTSNSVSKANTPPVTAIAPTQAPVAAGLPKVQHYDLPVASLIQVAEGSGLQWVNSDPEKIAVVKAAIAAEPKLAHVPRERQPVVIPDEGPLVLVETRKDLSEVKLPF